MVPVCNILCLPFHDDISPWGITAKFNAVTGNTSQLWTRNTIAKIPFKLSNMVQIVFVISTN